jgi:hypothetical protein
MVNWQIICPFRGALFRNRNGVCRHYNFFVITRLPKSTGGFVLKQLVLLLFVPLSACATLPQSALTKLNMDDPKYNTEGCRDIRRAALGYDDKTMSRAGLGLATGLLLGPIGIIPSAMADASQNNKRSLLNEELKRQCVTEGFTTTSNTQQSVPSNAKSDLKQCKEMNGEMKCE